VHMMEPLAWAPAVRQFLAAMVALLKQLGHRVKLEHNQVGVVPAVIQAVFPSRQVQAALVNV